MLFCLGKSNRKLKSKLDSTEKKKIALKAGI